MAFSFGKPAIIKYLAKHPDTETIVIAGAYGRKSAIRALGTILGSQFTVSFGVNKGIDADIIMLDNMSVEDMKEAVRLTQGKAVTECSGNVTKENVARLVDIGVDYISSGALTHSSPILDLSLKNLHAI